ncbi:MULTISPECIES: hypothetical protein [unclassified Sinorhizobium]|uniref:hypothetical protein n=1 Tax=unclassified Sinorhizobium TaxID=2613772 RepID=UPI0035249A4E
MAKNKMPKKFAGYKVPKSIRQSPVVKALLSSDIGRNVLANALTAGAGAAAAVLIGDRDEIADAAKKGTKKSVRAMTIVSDALSRGAEAAFAVVKDSAHDALPKKLRKGYPDRPSRAGAVH